MSHFSLSKPIMVDDLCPMDCVYCGQPTRNGTGFACQACADLQKAGKDPRDAHGRHPFFEAVFLVRDTLAHSIPVSVLCAGSVAVVALLIFTFAGFSSLKPEDFQLPVGITISTAPLQENLSVGKRWKVDDVEYTALARYDIRARVIFAVKNWLDLGSSLSPMDLSVSWGTMSDTAMLRRLNFSHAGRFVGWWSRDPAIDIFGMGRYIANMHIIPANDAVNRTIKTFHTDSLIHMTGYLVEVNSGSVSGWRSSLARDDGGAGACEIMWVEKAVSLRN